METFTVASERMTMTAKILEKKDPRNYVKHIFIKDGFAYATDGKILVKIASALPDGFYRPIRITKKLVELLPVEAFDYPAVESVLEFKGHANITGDIMLDTFPTAFATITRASDPDFCFDPDYVKIAYSITNGNCEVFTSGGQALIFTNDTTSIAVMPRKI